MAGYLREAPESQRWAGKPLRWRGAGILQPGRRSYHADAILRHSVAAPGRSYQNAPPQLQHRLSRLSGKWDYGHQRSEVRMGTGRLLRRAAMELAQPSKSRKSPGGDSVLGERLAGDGSVEA